MTWDDRLTGSPSGTKRVLCGGACCLLFVLGCGQSTIGRFGVDGSAGDGRPAACGNGVIDPGETCDGNCPTACDDGNACTVDTMTGSAANCNVVCSHQPITQCHAGDGCCPAGCSHDYDADCSATCGNGTVEPGETCDGDCPTSCDDGNACTIDLITGSAANCNVACSHQAISQCLSYDGCCPAGCTWMDDADCSATCGNGTVELGETCDGDCPTSCDDGNACTVDTMTGSAANCSAACSHQAITACHGGDGCCPLGCTPASDSDCGGSCAAAAVATCPNGWQLLGGGPLNVDLATGAYTPAIAAAPNGDVVVTWQEFGPPYHVFVKRWNGTAWTLLGGGLAMTGGLSRVVIDAGGAPVVIWQGDQHHAHVARWDGATWTAVGALLNVNPTWIVDLVDIAADRQGNLVAAWSEWDGDRQFDVFVARWDGSAWTVLGDAPIDMNQSDLADFPVVAIDCAGRPIVAWNERDITAAGTNTFNVTYVKRWDGAAWEVLGGGPQLPAGPLMTGWPSLAIGPTGDPFVAFYDFLSVSATDWTDYVHVRRWDGTQWLDFPLLGQTQSVAPVIAVDGLGYPTVAYYQSIDTHAVNSVMVAGWSGSAWQAVGANPLDLDATQSGGNQRLVIDAAGHPTVAWQEPNPATGEARVYVKQCR
jgi:hypothetical protein